MLGFRQWWTGRRGHNQRKCQIVWWHYCRNVGCLHAPSGEALRGIVQWWPNGVRVNIEKVLRLFGFYFRDHNAKCKISNKFYLCKVIQQNPWSPKGMSHGLQTIASFFWIPVGLPWPTVECWGLQLVWKESVLTTEYVLKGTFTSAPGLHYLPASFSKDAASAACSQAYLLHASLSLLTLSLLACVTCLHTSINDRSLL